MQTNARSDSAERLHHQRRNPLATTAGPVTPDSGWRRPGPGRWWRPVSAATRVFSRVLGLDRRAWTGVDRGQAGLDPGCSGRGVAGGLGAGVHPDHPVAVDRGGGGVEGAPDPVGVLEPFPGAAVGLDPGRGVGLGPVAEPGVLASAVRDDGDEPSTVGGDVAHRVGEHSLESATYKKSGPPTRARSSSQVGTWVTSSGVLPSATR